MEMPRSRIADESLMRLVGKCLHVGVTAIEACRISSTVTPRLSPVATMAITVREIDRTADRGAVEAIDTTFETETVFDLVTLRKVRAAVMKRIYCRRWPMSAGIAGRSCDQARANALPRRRGSRRSWPGRPCSSAS